MDIFALTETEFFRCAAAKTPENIHIAYRDFVLQVYQMCHAGTRQKSCVICALLVAEIDLTHLKNDAEREAVNNQLTAFISKAIHFLQHTLIHFKDAEVVPVEDDDIIQEIDLKWTQKKIGLVELGYAFKLAKCFGEHISVKELVQKLAKLFNVDIPDNYIYKKYNEIKVRSKDSRTYFIDFLRERLMLQMDIEDEED